MINDVRSNAGDDEQHINYVVLKSVASDQIRAELMNIASEEQVIEVLDALSLRSICMNHRGVTVILENSKHHRHRVALPNIVGALKQDGSARHVVCVTVDDQLLSALEVWSRELLDAAGASAVLSLNELRSYIEAISAKQICTEQPGAQGDKDFCLMHPAWVTDAPRVVVGDNRDEMCVQKKALRNGLLYEQADTVQKADECADDVTYRPAQMPWDYTACEADFIKVQMADENLCQHHDFSCHPQRTHADNKAHKSLQIQDASDKTGNKRVLHTALPSSDKHAQTMSTDVSTACACVPAESHEETLNIPNNQRASVFSSVKQMPNQCAKGQQGRLVVVTGLQGGSGASSVAQGLACWFAGHQITTILIDAHPLRQVCAQSFGLVCSTQEPPGLSPSQLLEYRRSHEQAQRTLVNQIAYSPQRSDEYLRQQMRTISDHLLLFEPMPAVFQSGDVRSLVLQQFIEQARAYAQVVIVDVPQLLLAELPGVCARLDRLVTTLAPRDTSSAALQSYIRQMQAHHTARTRLLFVINGLMRHQNAEELMMAVRRQVAITAVKALPHAGDRLQRMQAAGAAIQYFTSSQRHALALAQLAHEVGLSLGVCKTTTSIPFADLDEIPIHAPSMLQKVSSFLRGEAA